MNREKLRKARETFLDEYQRMELGVVTKDEYLKFKRMFDLLIEAEEDEPEPEWAKRIEEAEKYWNRWLKSRTEPDKEMPHEVEMFERLFFFLKEALRCPRKPEPEEKIEVGDNVWIPGKVIDIFTDEIVTVRLNQPKGTVFRYLKSEIRKKPKGA